MRVFSETLLVLQVMGAGHAPPRELACSVVKDGWVVPAEGDQAEPVWGIDGGMAVGLWPMPGPRGLIRIYAPYLKHGRTRVINFVAVEPVVDGKRGYSELEMSQWDGAPGKAMWTEQAFVGKGTKGPPWQPARAQIQEVDGEATLSFVIRMEPFNNGAVPMVQVLLKRDRPHEVAFVVHHDKDSASMDACILTATMGNYARLRRLWLREKIVEASELWPGFQLRHPFGLGFAPHRQWGLDELTVIDGEIIAAATPDEEDPCKAEYGEDTPTWWRYQGRKATQYWRTKAARNVVARVNGRMTYWGTKADIPGGVSFENFELQAPYEPGQIFVFGVSPDRPETWLGREE